MSYSAYYFFIINNYVYLIFPYIYGKFFFQTKLIFVSAEEVLKNKVGSTHTTQIKPSLTCPLDVRHMTVGHR